jgi:hypothetical protein
MIRSRAFGAASALFSSVGSIFSAASLRTSLRMARDSLVVIAMINTYEGIRSVDPLLINAMRMLGAKPRQLFTTVLLPNSIAWMLASLRVSGRLRDRGRDRRRVHLLAQRYRLHDRQRERRLRQHRNHGSPFDADVLRCAAGLDDRPAYALSAALVGGRRPHFMIHQRRSQ